MSRRKPSPARAQQPDALEAYRAALEYKKRADAHLRECHDALDSATRAVHDADKDLRDARAKWEATVE